MSNSTKKVVYIPVKLDAFVLNQSSSKGYPNSASVAPIAQPNYTFLRLDAGLIQNDVLPYHDISHASPAALNPRMTDLATGLPKTKRQGVYLHWMLPRCYRSGTTQQTGSRITAPKFKTAPDRWLVVRRLHPGAEPADPIKDGRIKELTAWIVESNRVRNVQALDRSVDIETECSPYLEGGGDLTTLNGQAEIYIGQKTQLPPGHEWREPTLDPQQKPNFVPLGTLNAANPLFADYVCHNMNVLSMLDNFGYAQGDGTTAYLTKATASYYVMGWHGDPGDDFLSNPGSLIMKDFLAQNFLDMPTAKDDVWLRSHDGGRALCHGAMYSVNYTSAESATLIQPSAKAAAKLSNKDSHPVTIGTTPLDTVMSYVRAYNDGQKVSGDEDPALEQTEVDLLHLETLLLNQEDDIDAQQEAHDMMNANNFEPCQDSGSFWSFSAAPPTPNGASSQPGSASRTQVLFDPSDEQKNKLKKLNDAQAALDAASRELQLERWGLFALWWKFESDRAWQDVSKANGVRQMVADQMAVVKALKLHVGALAGAIPATYLLPFQNPKFDSTKPEYFVEQGAQKRFYTQKDPTMLIPGLPNPWPADWLNPTTVRLASQTQVPPLPGLVPSGWQSLQSVIEKVVAPCLSLPEMQPAASSLLKEFFNLRPVDAGSKESASFLIGKDVVSAPLLPQYHDGRDQWNNTQAWFPLFVEWEATYYHIPWNAWDFEPTPDAFQPNEQRRFRYGIKQDQIVADIVKGKDGTIKDEREIDGRVLVLPQPGYSLRISVEQLLKATNPGDLPDTLTRKIDPITKVAGPDPQLKFLSLIDQIQMLSAPMTGFMDNLVTRLQGTHIKPTFRDPANPDMDGNPGVLAAAVNRNDPNSPWKEEVFQQMGADLDFTPFSDFVPFDAGVAPLKPVTHGQFRFTKLNIIDKFGQAISAIDPRPSNNIPPLYPNLSEYFHPQNLDGNVGRDNVIVEDSIGCQYAQWPPTINQDARLNTDFMIFDDGPKMWRPCGDWDDPVWGFVVLNYQENGVQIFKPDGQFYREVRLGGPTGATPSLEWQPFEPPKDKDGKYLPIGYPQLDALMVQLSNPAYLRSFFGMVNQALAALPHTPNQYAEFLNAIIGRPLALTNIGLSLELSHPVLKNQSTLSNTPEDVGLLDYSFPVKIGDLDRSYDGLVCLFEQPAKRTPSDPARITLPPGTELDLSSMVTYYPSGDDKVMSTYLDRDHYPELSPFHLSAASSQGPLEQQLTKFTTDRYSQTTMFGALVDPFSKVHAYSGILPIASVQLPSWTLQNAMQKMTAFFRMGPLVITTPDLQTRYNEKNSLSLSYNAEEMAKEASAALSPPAVVDNTPTFTGIPLPALASASWNWLQPYAVTVPPPAPAPGKPAAKPTKKQSWNPFPIASLDNRPKYEPGPYTAIEGFLQLKKPIVTGKMP